jgi:hypothetical protein
MNEDHDIERRLIRLSQGNPPSELRERILSRVAVELATGGRQRAGWGWTVAAALLLALGLNLLANIIVDQRLASYRQGEQIPFRAVDHPTPPEMPDLHLATLPWMKWADANHTYTRDDFERYLADLLARSSASQVQHLP